MPPRFAYWTILVGGLPTAFRAAEREEMLPTFKRLQQKHPDAEMRWFARGKLWASPAEAREALKGKRLKAQGERRLGEGRDRELAAGRQPPRPPAGVQGREEAGQPATTRAAVRVQAGLRAPGARLQAPGRAQGKRLKAKGKRKSGLVGRDPDRNGASRRGRPGVRRAGDRKPETKDRRAEARSPWRPGAPSPKNMETKAEAEARPGTRSPKPGAAETDARRPEPGARSPGARPQPKAPGPQAPGSQATHEERPDPGKGLAGADRDPRVTKRPKTQRGPEPGARSWSPGIKAVWKPKPKPGAARSPEPAARSRGTGDRRPETEGHRRPETEDRRPHPGARSPEPGNPRPPRKGPGPRGPR